MHLSLDAVLKMGWFGWGGSSQPKLSAEESARLQRKLRPERQAYSNCVRANKGVTRYCDQLEVGVTFGCVDSPSRHIL